MKNCFQSYTGSRTQQVAHCWAQPAGPGLEWSWGLGRSVWRDGGSLSILHPGIKGQRRKAPLNEWCSEWAGNMGNGPCPWKAEKVPFLLIPSLWAAPPYPTLTLPQLIFGPGEKPSCVTPSACCASPSFYLCPGLAVGLGFQLPEILVSHQIFPRWASEKCQLHQNCLL